MVTHILHQPRGGSSFLTPQLCCLTPPCCLSLGWCSTAQGLRCVGPGSGGSSLCSRAWNCCCGFCREENQGGKRGRAKIQPLAAEKRGSKSLCEVQGWRGPAPGQPVPKPLRFQHPKSPSSHPAPPISAVLLCADIKARASTLCIPTFAAGCALILPSPPRTVHSLLIERCF